MEKIYSKVDGSLLHIVYRREDLESQYVPRVNFGEESDFLQVASIKSPPNKDYASHIHLPRDRELKNLKAQESWVVIVGGVEVHYFDLDEKPICSRKLYSGDLTITFHGGHGYSILEKETLVYEFKSGPYEGIEIDKRFIN